MSRQYGTALTGQHPASWWIVLIAGTLVVIFAVAMVREGLKSREVRRQIKVLREAVVAEEERHKSLGELIGYLSSPTFQEREARLKLGLKKPDERVYLVPPGSDQQVIGDGDSGGGSAQEDLSIPQRWWTYFFPPTDLHNSPGSS
jgi:hypothetical protein